MKKFTFMTAQYGGAHAYRVDQARWLDRESLKVDYKPLETWSNGSKEEGTVHPPKEGTALVHYWYDPGIEGRSTRRSYWLVTADDVWTEIDKDAADHWIDRLVKDLEPRIKEKLLLWQSQGKYVWRHDCPHTIEDVGENSLTIQNVERRDEKPETLSFRSFLEW